LRKDVSGTDFISWSAHGFPQGRDAFARCVKERKVIKRDDTGGVAHNRNDYNGVIVGAVRPNFKWRVTRIL